MNKKINLSNTAYELCKEYPEIADILRDLGFQYKNYVMYMQVMTPC